MIGKSRYSLKEEKKADFEKTKVSNNSKESLDVLQTKNENNIHEKTKKQNEAKFNKDEIAVTSAIKKIVK